LIIRPSKNKLEIKINPFSLNLIEIDQNYARSLLRAFWIPNNFVKLALAYWLVSFR